jgi:hypothetical protein
MPGPSVTYTFSNGTTADASQVNTNFTDLINGSTDGTKDYIINTLECNGNASLEGNVTLGNGTVDDITISGSLASTINIKTTFSYDIGTSTIGLRDIYLGDAGSAARTTKIRGGTVASSWTLTLPTTGGTDGFFLQTNGSGTTSWSPVAGPTNARNYSVSASVGSSALTIALKGADGNDPSSSNIVSITFRNSTAATGTPVTRTVTGALSIVIPSTATMGHADATDEWLYLYAIDNAGTVVLGVSSSAAFDEGSLQSTTAISTSADSLTPMYSDAGLSSKPVRFLGRLKSVQTTAGTWASVPTEISLYKTSGDFKIGALLATRVTTAAPNTIGEYRSYLRDAGANTFTETNGNPTAVPSAADGIKLYNGNTFAAADTNNEPTKYDIFVGKNKKVIWEFYASAARTGYADITPRIGTASTDDFGYHHGYDPSTGIAWIVGCRGLGSGTTHTSAVGGTNNAVNDIFFDITVSDII